MWGVLVHVRGRSPPFRSQALPILDFDSDAISNVFGISQDLDSELGPSDFDTLRGLFRSLRPQVISSCGLGAPRMHRGLKGGPGPFLVSS